MGGSSKDSEALTVCAQYGCLAFDVFLMERWDHAADPAKDAEQWKSAVHAYLALTPAQRYPYHRESRRRMNGGYRAEPEVAARLFAPYQTPRERNMTARRANTTDPEPVCIRTCYDADLADAYKSLVEAGLSVSAGLYMEKDTPLDDAALYDCGDDWSRVMLRLPELCDVVRLHDWQADEQARVEIDADEDEPLGDADDEMYRIALKVVTRLYVMDRKALEKGLVKISLD